MDYETPTRSSELRIVLLGKNGVNKSAVGNKILNRQAFKEICTRVSEVQRGRVEDQNISVIDTPGFFNTELNDEDLQNEMMKSLSFAHPGPHVFLLIVRPETFIEHDVGNIVQKIQGTFGAQVFKFTIVLIIREQISNREWMAFTFSKIYQDLISHFRGKYHVMNNETTQITTLLEKIENVVKQNDNQHYNQKYIKFPVIQKGEEKRVKMAKTVPDLFIALLGITGAGKSASGNTIIGGDINTFIEGFLPGNNTAICHSANTEVDGKSINVIDTASFTSPSINQIEQMFECAHDGFDVFLLAIKLGDKYTEQEQKTTKLVWIQEIIGAKALQHTIVLFIHGDLLEEPVEEYLSKSETLRSVVDQCSGRYHVFNNKSEDQSQVTELLRKAESLREMNSYLRYTKCGGAVGRN
nr:GTPase IMAP family member 8-like [Misgurnus anguillicaudatus]